MKFPQIEEDSTGIVLLGTFNPPIFQPAWFGANSLIRNADAEAAEIGVISPAFSSFSTECFQLEVNKDRFSTVSSGSAFREALRDLVTGTFTLLSHTPMRTLGLNRLFHFRMDSKQNWHEVGHRLAPKDIWGKVLQNPGMEDLQIKAERPDGRAGCIRAIVQPSVKYIPGVFIQISEQFDLKKGEEDGAEKLMVILKEVWDESLKRSDNIVQTIFDNI